MSSSLAAEVYDKFENEFVDCQSPTEPKALTDESLVPVLKGEFDKKFNEIDERFNEVNKNLTNLINKLNLGEVPNKEPKGKEKADATNAGNGSESQSDSESSLDSDEDLLENINTPISETLERGKGYSTSNSKEEIRRSVWRLIDKYEDQLQKLPELDTSPETIAKYKTTLKRVYTRIPPLKEIVLNDFNLKSTSKDTVFLDGHSTANKVYFYKLVAENIASILSENTATAFENEAGNVTLKKIIGYIETHDGNDCSAQIIEYIKKFKKIERLTNTSDIENHLVRITSVTDRQITQFLKTLNSRDAIAYFIYVNNSNESNVKALGRQLNEQYQAFKNDSSKVAAPLRHTFLKMRSDSNFIDMPLNSSDKQLQNKKSHTHGYKKNQNYTESQKNSGNKNFANN